jgi:hypothetical protein
MDRIDLAACNTTSIRLVDIEFDRFDKFLNAVACRMMSPFRQLLGSHRQDDAVVAADQLTNTISFSVILRWATISQRV